VRILSNVAYSGIPQTTAPIVRRPDTFCSNRNYFFWSQQLSLRDEHRFKLSGVTHAQITDVYLLAIAAENGGRLATARPPPAARRAGGGHDIQLTPASLFRFQPLKMNGSRAALRRHPSFGRSSSPGRRLPPARDAHVGRDVVDQRRADGIAMLFPPTT